LTDQLEVAIRDYLDRIDEHGGAIGALESGFLEAEIDEQAYAVQRRIDSGEQAVVGVNRHVHDGATHAASTGALVTRSERDGGGPVEALARCDVTATERRRPPHWTKSARCSEENQHHPADHLGGASKCHGRRDLPGSGDVWGRFGADHS